MDATSFQYYRVIERYRYPASGYHHLPECVHVVLAETPDYTLEHPSPQTYVYRLCLSAGGNMGTAIPGWLPFLAYGFGDRVHEMYEATSHDVAGQFAPRLIAYTDLLRQDHALRRETLLMLQDFLSYRDESIQRIRTHPPLTTAAFEQIVLTPLDTIRDPNYPHPRAVSTWLHYYEPSR